jgi:hypothetical protein
MQKWLLTNSGDYDNFVTNELDQHTATWATGQAFLWHHSCFIPWQRFAVAWRSSILHNEHSFQLKSEKTEINNENYRGEARQGQSDTTGSAKDVEERRHVAFLGGCREKRVRGCGRIQTCAREIQGRCCTPSAPLDRKFIATQERKPLFLTSGTAAFC